MKTSISVDDSHARIISILGTHHLGATLIENNWDIDEEVRHLLQIIRSEASKSFEKMGAMDRLRAIVKDNAKISGMIRSETARIIEHDDHSTLELTAVREHLPADPLGHLVRRPLVSNPGNLQLSE